MAQRVINVGSSANKGDGDPIRTAFTKVNDNFTELYGKVAVIENQIVITQDVQGDLFGGDSSKAYDSATGTFYGKFVGDLKGTIAADDSTVLIDGPAGTINATALTGALPAIDGSALTNLAPETDPVVGAINGLVKADGAGNISQAVAGTDYLVSYTETDPVVGAITGIVKADGAGNISTAVAGTDYLTLTQSSVSGYYALDINKIDNGINAAGSNDFEILTYGAFDINIKQSQWSSENAFRIDAITGTDIRHTNSSPRIQTQNYGTEFLNGVIKLPVLTSAPTSPADGMVAIADGSSWDPYGIGVQSMVVYLNGSWRLIADAV